MDLQPCAAQLSGRLCRRLVGVFALLLLALAAMTAAPSASMAQGVRPCDILSATGSPCVAAHSTTRALFHSYAGNLYQVLRTLDNKTQDIPLLTPGGYANSAVQDKFCQSSYCVISKIYDQTPNHNDLQIGGAGGAAPEDFGAPANALPVNVGGHPVYGVSISPGMGYHSFGTRNVATNGQPESAYMVTSGTHVNGNCCFDYGNAEVSVTDTGNGHMDAINFSTECWFGNCTGTGPWVQADLENGLFQSNVGYNMNPTNTGNPQPFVTAWLSNNGRDSFTLRVGNAAAGKLSTLYHGAEPVIAFGYSPMHQEGAIVLGTGGDNSNGGAGSFFEGAMTLGTMTGAAQAMVQSNVVLSGYSTSTGRAGSLKVGSEVSIQVTTGCCTTGYWGMDSSQTVNTTYMTATSSAADKLATTWIVRPGFADSSCISFQAKGLPGEFIRQTGGHLYVQPYDGTAQFDGDSTFCAYPSLNGRGTNSFSGLYFPGMFIRFYDDYFYLAQENGPNPWDTPYVNFDDDASFNVVDPWSP